MRRFTLPSKVLFLVALGGCAANPAPPSESAESSETEETSDESADSTGDGSLEAHRESFMQGCVERAQSDEYCSCAFDQFREVFAGVDVSESLPPSDPRFAKLKERTMAACGSTLSEDQVQSNFVNACVDGDDRKDAYCACAWTALRKKLEPADFLGSADTPAFVAAKESMVVECKGKFPVEVARFEFMSACTENEATREARCTCLWNKIKAKFATEEIAAGTADLSQVPGLAECK